MQISNVKASKQANKRFT